MTAHRVVLLSSEWLGSEGARVVQEILSAAGVSIEWSELACGQGPLAAEALEPALQVGLACERA